jgi:hypothetical protein
MAAMNEKELKKMWNGTKVRPNLRHLFHLMVATLVSVPSTSEDRRHMRSRALHTAKSRTEGTARNSAQSQGGGLGVLAFLLTPPDLARQFFFARG